MIGPVMRWALEQLFSTAGFPARWVCGRWTPLHGWLHIAADMAVFSAYAAIPVALVYFVRKRRDVPFLPIFWLFAAFILACGVGHLVDASVFWRPHYRLLTGIKLFTAVVSWLTVVGLVRVIPKALALQQSERRFALAVQGSSDGLWDADLLRDESFFSERFCEMLGYSQSELAPRALMWSELVHPDDRAATYEAIALHLELGVALDVETRLLTKAGAPRWFRLRGQAIWNDRGQATRMAGSLTDISADKAAAQAIESVNAMLDQRVQERTAELSAMLREREVLLREIHHRVKNNLQVISSLINLQRVRLPLSADSEALRQCQARVLTIARVHELLYRAHDAARIPLAEYIKSLVAGIDDMAALTPRVHIETDIDDVSLSVESGVPCGLILNELITNALKHGFVGERRGTIKVRVRRVLGSELALEVSDDGVGLPTNFDPSRSASLGLTITRLLAHQLRGELEVVRSHDTMFRVQFPAPDLALCSDTQELYVGSLLSASGAA
jgi:PAS domain S-box-containing protein